MNLLFIGVSGLLLGTLLVWGFKTLPGEEWQILASLPGKKVGPGVFSGINLTYYGLFNATAQTIAVVYLCILVLSLDEHLPLASVLFLACFELLLAWVAAKAIARIVEKRQNTFTVCGAFFMCLVTTPWVLMAMNKLNPGNHLPFMPLLSAAAIAYAIGEGVGRLACISFGCCYGKPLSTYSPSLQRMLRPWAFVFEGKTKKISYESGLDGQPVLPVQAVTAALYVGAALLATSFFLGGGYSTALVLIVVVTQVWRTISELLRADYRGGGKITAYQIMSGVAVVYVSTLTMLAPSESHLLADVRLGLARTFSPGILITAQLIWVAAFVYMGRSKVTASTLSMHVCEGIRNVG